MKVSSLVLAGLLSLTATVATASTVLTPVDGDANFLVSDSFYNAGYQLAIFDDSATVSSGVITTAGLDVNLTGPTCSIFGCYYGGLIGFTNQGNSNWSATNTTPTSITLTGSSDFIVGLSVDGGNTWLADNNTAIGGSANTVTLNYSVPGTNGVSTFVVDVQLTPVPVPAAAWLFGTGLLGLVGVARRRVA